MEEKNQKWAQDENYFNHNSCDLILSLIEINSMNKMINFRLDLADYLKTVGFDFDFMKNEVDNKHLSIIFISFHLFIEFLK
mgnify:CR=1 FL=1